MEARVMRDANNVLELVRRRGEQGKTIERLYRLLYNPEMYLNACGKIYQNEGSMAPGVTAETVDRDLERINAIIDRLKGEKYWFQPVRRQSIPKKNGKMRPSGTLTWSDELLQKVLRQILGAYYEPQFSESSHGFRPDRGCHTALKEIKGKWTGVKWLIEGDIVECFDNISHDRLLEIVGEKVADGKAIELIRRLLKAGYMGESKQRNTLTGTPRGGIISPLLANVYMDKLDKYVENVLIPEYTRGKERKPNQEWKRLLDRAHKFRKRGNTERARELEKQAKILSSTDEMDPEFRRLKYIRYADDFLLGFIGPKEEAEAIKERIKNFLREELSLELSAEKTLITNAKWEAARFLGYEISTSTDDGRRGENNRRTINGKIRLRIPKDVIREKCDQYQRKHKAILINDSDISIIERYEAEFRGFVEYYGLANNLGDLTRLKRKMERSLVGTLANKHKTTNRKIYARYKRTLDGRKVLTALKEMYGTKPLIAIWGKVTLRKRATGQPEPPETRYNRSSEREKSYEQKSVSGAEKAEMWKSTISKPRSSD
ncbi:MAG TPA: reverse transcriptase domain-containing protein [Ktedonobacteraceae bacterium]|jgi:group II intron reverse transcriptase/maturase